MILIKWKVRGKFRRVRTGISGPFVKLYFRVAPGRYRDELHRNQASGRIYR